MGSIRFTAEQGKEYRKGDELGYFAFGGSTIIVLFGKGAITIDQDLLHNRWAVGTHPQGVRSLAVWLSGDCESCPGLRQGRRCCITSAWDGAAHLTVPAPPPSHNMNDKLADTTLCRSKKSLETLVKMGNRLGCRPDSPHLRSQSADAEDLAQLEDQTAHLAPLDEAMGGLHIQVLVAYKAVTDQIPLSQVDTNQAVLSSSGAR